jgi:hypothetical protein
VLGAPTRSCRMAPGLAEHRFGGRGVDALADHRVFTRSPRMTLRPTMIGCTIAMSTGIASRL